TPDGALDPIGLACSIRREPRHEVLAVPLKDLRHTQRGAVDGEPPITGQIAARGCVELRLEHRGAIGLGGERRASDRGAVDREMDARLLELRTQDAMLD